MEEGPHQALTGLLKICSGEPSIVSGEEKGERVIPHRQMFPKIGMLKNVMDHCRLSRTRFPGDPIQLFRIVL